MLGTFPAAILLIAVGWNPESADRALRRLAAAAQKLQDLILTRQDTCLVVSAQCTVSKADRKDLAF